MEGHRVSPETGQGRGTGVSGPLLEALSVMKSPLKLPPSHGSTQAPGPAALRKPLTAPCRDGTQLLPAAQGPGGAGPRGAMGPGSAPRLCRPHPPPGAHLHAQSSLSLRTWFLPSRVVPCRRGRSRSTGSPLSSPLPAAPSAAAGPSPSPRRGPPALSSPKPPALPGAAPAHAGCPAPS